MFYKYATLEGTFLQMRLICTCARILEEIQPGHPWNP
ncbi:hypothetical protein T10_3942 [Trichinella papuae]|uniref:Uncharacterized protein n=1 Tax=Trichinella papuae TaxID=268474 RepID=A0A0V1LYU4_9BILA|nr:hypothetical protein T10_3942 [Trichinella papuae]